MSSVWVENVPDRRVCQGRSPLWEGLPFRIYLHRVCVNSGAVLPAIKRRAADMRRALWLCVRRRVERAISAAVNAGGDVSQGGRCVAHQRHRSFVWHPGRSDQTHETLCLLRDAVAADDHAEVPEAFAPVF